MSNDIPLSCRCGSFKAVIHDANSKTGNHAICYCVDCQAFARHLGQAGRVMDEKGGTEIYQTQPYQVEILAGAEHLAVLQLAEKGLYRWYTNCCNTPICNTLGTPKFSFAGFLTANMTDNFDATGPVQFRYKREQALAPVAEPSGSLARFAFRTMRRAAMSRITGKWKKTPFFDAATGRSLAKPTRLSEAERSAAYSA
ncbi:MAG: DUF6151 family protein [Pseudomonadota bacterium]